MVRTSSAVMIAVLAWGCGKKQETPAADPPKGSAGSSAPAGSATPPPAPGSGSGSGSATPAAPAVGILGKKLAETTGIAFAETKGGKVSGKGGDIPDGTVITITGEVEPQAGSHDDVTVTVQHAGKSITVSADRVLRDGNLRRSADGKYAVFHTIVACGDLCHSVIWLVGDDGARTKLGEAGPDVAVAWHPKATHVAVGAAQLWIATLPDLVAKRMEDYRAPAYAPDGTLYVRDAKGSAYTVDAGKATVVWKNKVPLATEQDGMPADDPDPVTFENGKPRFEIKK